MAATIELEWVGTHEDRQAIFDRFTFKLRHRGKNKWLLEIRDNEAKMFKGVTEHTSANEATRRASSFLKERGFKFGQTA